MSLDISNDIITAQNALLRQSNGIEIQEYMNRNNFGSQTPVDTSFIKSDNDRKIIITSEVQEKLDAINEVCKEDGTEIPYFLTGTKLEDDTIRFDEIIISCGTREQQSATSNKDSVTQMDRFVTKNKNNPNAIVCHGHTHPPHGEFYNQFSVADLGAYVNFKNNPKFGQVDSIGMVLVDGSYNFVDYDNNEFHKIKNVFNEVQENEKYELLPSYSHERVNEIQNIDNINQQEPQNMYVEKFTNGWDEYFNHIVEQSGNDKNYIKREMIYQAEALNNTVYKLQCEGKITEEQAEQIYGSFNISFNQAFEDFELSPLTEKDLQQTVHSMNYTKEKVKQGMSIEDIDKMLAETTRNYMLSKESQKDNKSKNSLVEYKKQSFIKKMVTRVKEFYNNIRKNRITVEDTHPITYINNCEQIIRRDGNSFTEDLQAQLNVDIQQVTPQKYNNVQTREIETEDFTEK